MAKTIKSKLKSYQGPACPHCGRKLSSEASGHLTCIGCRNDFEAIFFVPPKRKVHVAQSTGSADATSICAKHERNVAVANCDRCGNFMCNLCKIDTDGMALCPTCFERMSAEGSLPSAVKSIKNYAGMAGTSAAIGLFICFIGFISGPLAIYYGYKGLQQNKEFGDTRRTIGIVAAMILGLAEFVLSLIFVFALLAGNHR